MLIGAFLMGGHGYVEALGHRKPTVFCCCHAIVVAGGARQKAAKDFF